MKFIITRTSDTYRCLNGKINYYCGMNKRPCKESKSKIIHQKERYTNKIIKVHCWVIEFDTLDELFAFMKKYNIEIILSWDDSIIEKEYNYIEIYDDYRE